MKRKRKPTKVLNCILKPKRTRLYYMVDNDSYEGIMRLYKLIKGDKTYSLDNFILFKSVIKRIVEAQSETATDGFRDKVHRRWVTPSEYFERMSYIDTRFGERRNDKELLDYLLKIYNNKNGYRGFDYNYCKDYGKIL